MQTYTIQQINHQMATDAAGWIAQAEAAYQQQIVQVATAIAAQQATHPLVLVNGASSAGKTTTSNRIVAELAAQGISAQRISMDDYYISRNDIMPYDDENDLPDWESPLCMDLELLADHLQKLVQGQEILIPHYDFAAGIQHLNVTPMLLEPHEVAVIEGIHAFNPVIMGNLTPFATTVWLAPDAQLIDEQDGQVISSDVLRFARRAVRDAQFRNAPFAATVRQWKSVSRGERLYINPYRHQATQAVSTYLPYEDAILFGLLGEHLQNNRQAVIDAGLGGALLAAARFQTVDCQHLVPANSLLREFIG